MCESLEDDLNSVLEAMSVRLGRLHPLETIGPRNLCPKMYVLKTYVRTYVLSMRLIIQPKLELWSMPTNMFKLWKQMHYITV